MKCISRSLDRFNLYQIGLLLLCYTVTTLAPIKNETIILRPIEHFTRNNVATSAPPSKYFTNRAIENDQKIINYFTPYTEIIALKFLATLAHELGHAISCWPVTKKWPTIQIGEYEDPQKYLFNIAKLKIYLPNENLLDFRGETDQDAIDNNVLDAINSLLGPIFGVIFGITMLQFTQQGHLKYSLHAELFDDVVQNLLTENSDGSKALSALDFQTSWMEKFKANECPLLYSAFNLAHLEYIADTIMFAKIFKTRNENQRLISLSEQTFLKVVLPIALYHLQQITYNLIDNAYALVKKGQEYSLATDDYITIGAWRLLKTSVMVIPIIIMCGIIKLNAATPLHSLITTFSIERHTILTVQKPNQYCK